MGGAKDLTVSRNIEGLCGFVLGVQRMIEDQGG